MGSNIVLLGCPNPRFGRRGAPTLGSGGTVGRSRGIWEHKKGHFGVQAWIFIDLSWIPACHCESISGISGVKLFVFSMLDSESLFSRLLGLNPGVCSLKRKNWYGKCCKTTFPQQLEFSGLECSWDQFSWLLVPWRQALNSLMFHGYPETAPDHPRS